MSYLLVVAPSDIQPVFNDYPSHLVSPLMFKASIIVLHATDVSVALKLHQFVSYLQSVM